MSGRGGDERQPAMFVRKYDELKIRCLGDVVMGESLQCL